MLQETADSGQPLYAKIGCMERETFTSTKLQLHLYTDAACSVHYDDGQSKKSHVKNGYDVNGLYFGTKVSFRPPFYTCQTCQPDGVSDSFRKSSSYWYDDDYITEYGKRRQYDDDGANRGDDDTYYQYGDDAYDPNYQGDDDYYNRNDVSTYGVLINHARYFMEVEFDSVGSSAHKFLTFINSLAHILIRTLTMTMAGLGPAGPIRARVMVGGVAVAMMTFTIAEVCESMTRRKRLHSR